MGDKPKFKLPTIKFSVVIPRVDRLPPLDALRHSFGSLAKAMQNIDTDSVETEEIMKRMRSAKKDPDNPKSMVWEAAVGETTPRAASVFWRHLPDPLKRRGRPKGGAIAADEALFEEMTARIAKTGKAAKTVAREIVNERGGVEYAEIESRVNYIARLYKQRAKK